MIRSSNDVSDIVNAMAAAEIPLEVQWVDIDYMIDQRDFTVDPVAWGSMGNLTDMLHDNGQRFVLILDPAIPAEAGDDYLPAVSGLEEGVFIIDETGQSAVGTVWPGKTYFPDFHAPKTTEWWHYHVAELWEKYNFDGLWVDMNEPASFEDMDCSGIGSLLHLILLHVSCIS